MSETTPKRNEAVAWVERTPEGYTRMWSTDLSLWANRPEKPEPLYSAATVDALRSEVSRLRAVVEAARGLKFDLYDLTDDEIRAAFGGKTSITVAHLKPLRELRDAIKSLDPTP